METSYLDSIVLLLSTYKYLILLPIAFLEGPIISVIAGFLCSTGILNIPITYAILLLGDWGGDTLYYAIGRFGGRPLIRKWGHFLGFTEEKVLKIEKHFEKNAGKTLVVGKTQAIGMVFLTAAGLSKMPYGKFMLINLIISLPKTILFLVIGYFAGETYDMINEYLGIYGAVTTIALILGVGIYFFTKSRNNEK
ncbi:MAG: DedA family protein [Candidatus Gracilibacteria bacterium]|jgi:membrane protein DedA with SNARE-associated domain